MTKSKLMKANEKIADGVTSGFQKIEDGVVGTYKKVEDLFVDKCLTHEGESVEDAKKRLEAEQRARENASMEVAEKYTADRQARTDVGTDIGSASIEASMEASRAAVEASRNIRKNKFN